MQAELDFTTAACSAAAYETVKPCIKTQRQAILEYIIQCGTYGATDNEIQDALDLSGSTQRPRRGELAAMNKIKQNGKKRSNRQGNACAVWVACDV